MTIKIDRDYFERHKKELSTAFNREDQATPEQHEEILQKIRSGEIQGKVYPDGTATTMGDR